MRFSPLLLALAVIVLAIPSRAAGSDGKFILTVLNITGLHGWVRVTSDGKTYTNEAEHPDAK